MRGTVCRANGSPNETLCMLMLCSSSLFAVGTQQQSNDTSKKPSRGNVVRVNSGVLLSAEQWSLFSASTASSPTRTKTNDGDDGDDSDDAAAAMNNSADANELTAAQALSDIAKATIGDLVVATAAGKGRAEGTVAQKEEQVRSAAMTCGPALFVFERNIERAMATLPEMWRVRKFGN